MDTGHVSFSLSTSPNSWVSGRANALYIGDRSTAEASIRGLRRLVAWPTPGYVPAETMWDRWSFSLEDADFSNASVRVANEFGPVEVNVLDADGPFSSRPGHPAIMWSVHGFSDAALVTHVAGKFVGETPCYEVTVSGVVLEDITQPDYEYATCLVDIPLGSEE